MYPSCIRAAVCYSSADTHFLQVFAAVVAAADVYDN